MGIATFIVVVLTVSGAAPAAAQDAGPAGVERAAADDPLAAHIQGLERILLRAVTLGARGVEQQLPPWTPGLMLFAGPAQVRGFRLPEYGVFFDVECPVLRESILWSMEVMDADLRMMRRSLDRLRELSAFAPVLRELDPDANSSIAFSPNGLSSPADLRSRMAAGDAPPPAGSDVPLDLHAVYQDALREMLVDALLGYGGALGALLDRDDWLTVVARDTRGHPGRDTTVRVKAGDVAALHAGTLSLAEARARVDTSPF
jgi:hypothetical protein